MYSHEHAYHVSFKNGFNCRLYSYVSTTHFIDLHLSQCSVTVTYEHNINELHFTYGVLVSSDTITPRRIAVTLQHFVQLIEYLIRQKSVELHRTTEPKMRNAVCATKINGELFALRQ